MKIAFQGQRGSYTEAAAASLFANEDIATVSKATIDGLFEALESGEVEYAIVRYEHAAYGTSYEVIDKMRDGRAYFSLETHFHETYNLAGKRGAKFENIRHVSAHPAVLNLCKDYLETKPGNFDLIARFDIADATVEMIERADPSEAIICGNFASSIYGLSVIKGNCQNKNQSMTRFAALCKQKRSPRDNARNVYTSAMLELRHEPGALMDALGSFRKHGINLTTVDTRPQREEDEIYHVFVEFPGRFDEQSVREALAEMRDHADGLQLLGSYSCVEPRITKI